MAEPTHPETLSFPRQYARTRRFTLGQPRNLRFSRDGTRLYFLRSKGPTDPVLGLYVMDLASANERLLADPEQLSADPEQLSADPEQLSADPEQLSADPEELSLLDHAGNKDPQRDKDAKAIPAAELARRERARESATGIVSFSLAANDSTATFALGGELFVVDLASDTVDLLETAGSVFDPQLSPDGTHIAYVSGQGLRLYSLHQGSPESRALESRASDRELVGSQDPDVSWGRADFIAAEEMGRQRGFWWEGNSQSLLVARVDESQVSKWWIADPANPAKSPNQVRYPAAGTTNPQVSLFRVELGSGKAAEIDWSNRPNEPANEYLADVIVAAGHPTLIVSQTRDQRTLTIAELRSASLELSARHKMVDKHWVELIPGSPAWFGDELLTIEDITDTDIADAGRRALCLDGQPIFTELTHQARSIIAVADGRAIISAWIDPTEIHILSIDPHTGHVDQLTKQPGVHSAIVHSATVSAKQNSQPSSIAIASASPEHPGTETIVSTLNYSGPHKSRTDNAFALTPIATILNLADRPVLQTRPLFHLSKPGTAITHGAAPVELTLPEPSIHAAVILPSFHDGTSPLPILLDPYGGPHAQRVTKTNNSYLVSQWFAEQGFAVVIIDGRGTPGRGPRFERSVWGDLASLALDDQIRGLDSVAQQMPFLDLERVGIRGWSFGGYLAALAAIRRPDRIHAAVAGAPVTAWELYDTHYTERYLGHPDSHPSHYEQSSLLNEAHKLERPLMLIHGLADDNVVAAHSLQLSTALLAAGRAHQVLPLSGVTHMTPSEVVAENLLRLQLDFLANHLFGH